MPYKITVDVGEETYAQFKAQILWGLRRHLIKAVLELILDAVKKDGVIIAGAIIDGRYKLVRDDDATD